MSTPRDTSVMANLVAAFKKIAQNRMWEKPWPSMYSLRGLSWSWCTVNVTEPDIALNSIMKLEDERVYLSKSEGDSADLKFYLVHAVKSIVSIS